MKKLRSILNLIAIIALFVVGLTLIFIKPIQALLVQRLSEELVTVSTYSEILELNDEIEADFDFEEVQSLSIWEVLQAQTNRKDLPVIGSIGIPSVNMHLPILKGVGKNALAVGAGTMKPKQIMGQGNYALAAHYFEDRDILFGPLYRSAIGDAIFLTHADAIYEYQITKIEVVEATAVHVIEDVANETLLTLITCADEGVRRLLVQASFVQEYNIDSPPDALQQTTQEK
ncbi:class A sortase [Metasolibacillus meyeri]|uniref:Class A sortase n=1 Tax=Metasolibacillus meyeri TaxID=1071052 RepID=A0AAW9NM77_9BACL|nr:class A sortase [Metasolibacillus meyeri]MEC1176909.1 class A sortase [Metasolibacillus meyeri]